MAITITLTHLDTGNTKVLDSRQSHLVQIELQRVRRFSAPYDKNAPPIAADCEMIIDDNGKIKKYLVLRETVLLDLDKFRLYQFYMGLQLLQWLETP